MKYQLFLWLLALCIKAIGQPVSPILRIENGMHTATSFKASADAAGKYILTGSNDKTGRLWDASNGRLLRIFRIPIGKTTEGAIFASALSPDGDIAILGGNTGSEWDSTYCIYVLNSQTGEIIHRISNLPNRIVELEFTPNGRYLSIGMIGNAGVYIYNTSDWTLFKKLSGYKGSVLSLAYNRLNMLASTCYDGKLRLYDENFLLVREEGNLAGKQPMSITFNPAGNILAIGYNDVSTIELREAISLRFLGNANMTGINESSRLSSLCFAADGTYLLGGQNANLLSEGNWKFILRKWWKDANNFTYADFPITKNTIVNIRALADGRILVLGAYPEMVMLNQSLQVLWRQQAGNIDFRRTTKQEVLHVNETGAIVGFTTSGEGSLLLDIPSRILKKETASYPSPKDHAGATYVTNWSGSTKPVINGHSVDFLWLNERILSVDVSDRGDIILLGADFNIYRTDNSGKKIWSTTLASGVVGVKISGNQKVVVATLSDGTIRWFRLSDGKELLNFYLDADKKSWVLFTPSGYYDASPGAESLLGWHLNNGLDQKPDFYPVSRFRGQFYRPDLIHAVLQTYMEPEGIASGDKLNSKNMAVDHRDIRKKLPPTVVILKPFNGSTTSSNTVDIHYSINSPIDAPVKNLRVLLNGRPVSLQRGAVVVSSGVAEQQVTIGIPSQDCTITLLAENDNGVSPEANLYLKWTATTHPDEEFVYKPKLYALVIGISDYNNASFRLGLAAKDAGDFAQTLVGQKGSLYSDVVIKKLLNKDATKDAITDGLDWIQKQTGQKDLAMIFYAGHGMNDNNGIFYMLPVAADLSRIRTTCLNFEELKQTVSSIAGKVVVFIDACHSGNVMGDGRRSAEDDINSVVNELSNAQSGAVTFTSSTGKEFSLEDPKWGNGAFTKALLEGLKGKAAIAGKNKITVKSLDVYISERVKELTDGKQHPTSVVPPNVPDFPIAISTH